LKILQVKDNERMWC